ncbi:class I glutamine amidotransferase-like protein [Phaeosphaeria sp. MPI-PUGE-AT-0046c]|nr:class I glutamine amidotransferase-like protein [Phaeosphaeria sp. MPI-PUGE-AT-0046c]
MSTFDLSNPGRPIEAGVILMGQTEILDVAPIDLLHGISKAFVDVLPVSDDIKAKAPEVNFHWVTETGAPAKLTSHIIMEATDSFKTCPTLDIVLVGAYIIGYTPTAAELAFIASAHASCAAFITICGGMLAAQQAGVLAGKTATAPRFMVAELQAKDPRTTWVEKRYVRDGKVWTSGALLNGLDLMREFMRTYWPELAEVSVRIGGVPERANEYVGSDGMMMA